MSAHTSPLTHDVIIIGAGVSGIGAGIRLLAAGIDNIAILEKAADLGGTWRDNTYPGCACDVPSALYSYSFAQKPDWTRAFAGQAEILDYVRGVSERHGIGDYIHFNQAVERAQWREAQGLWEVQTSGQIYFARTIIVCSGYLHEPIVPNIPGLQDFPGKVFHSSRWDHDHNLTGERVAVIGTGASAIQFVPEIQPVVEQLTLFQRTPQWILPKPDHPIPRVEETFFRLPGTLKAWRKLLYAGFETFGVGFRHPAMLRQAQKLGLAHLRFTIKDPELRARLTPDYTLGCKRVLLSNNYYPALNQANVEVLATGLKEVRGKTLVGQDGSEREVDTVILGTGFHVTEPPIAERIYNNAGESLSQLWENGMQAYRGTTISGLPNAFMVLGPNLGIGHNSAFIVIESQLNYIVDALTTLRDRQLARFDIRREIQDRYNRKVQKDLQGTVWNTGGCSSYYLDKHGLNSVGFPWNTLKMQRLLKTFDADNYHLTPASQPVFGDQP
ncbi:flavin-containing monooxygenase [Marinobacter zhejiangensis]|uniref:Cyclohexanone monooxygenase n=1 Tax=Marinobacter zhejiangensis TaxID=488535 RepID=A0A1I4NBP7_9GAMM|nr:NAD(P)/FAD-dependent oxidoreductase [Marinobacter zhejiangensis]SFM12982.1 cyclohexanone monooxygenase [Marinobacter zhejiangensis]